MNRLLTQSFMVLLLFSIVTGVVYPLGVTVIAQMCCARQANGSLLLRDHQIVGSSLLAQPFSEDRYFWSRPSATTPQPYNGLASGGSNLSPTNPAQLDAVKRNLAALHQADPDNALPVPVDLVTASASGLDPHISPAAARFQIERVARARHLPLKRIAELVEQHTDLRQWGVFGEPRVNVLELNLALDTLH